MKTVLAKDLRSKAAMVLRDAEKGRETVIMKRGGSIAVLKPIERAPSRPFVAAGFGTWRDREDFVDSAAWVSNLRGTRDILQPSKG